MLFRSGIGIKTMSLANEDRGGLVGAFIVVDGDEILSITQGGQVVRSPINQDFRATGRSTMGVKFVSPKGNDTVSVVARSVEAKVVEEVAAEEGVADAEVSADVVADDAFEGAAVGGQVLTGREDREERRRHTRNALDQARCLRAALAVALSLVTEGVEEIGKPLIVVR